MQARTNGLPGMPAPYTQDSSPTMTEKRQANSCAAIRHARHAYSQFCCVDKNYKIEMLQAGFSLSNCF